MKINAEHTNLDNPLEWLLVFILYQQLTHHTADKFWAIIDRLQLHNSY